VPSAWAFWVEHFLLAQKYSGIDVSDAKRLKALETESARLKNSWRSRCECED